MKNPYEMYQKNSLHMNTDNFLNTAYTRMLTKVKRLREIQDIKSASKKNNLPIKMIEEKFMITSNILQAIVLLQDSIDFTSKNGPELSGILNDLGLTLSKGNIAQDNKEAENYYDLAITILESFIFDP